MNQETQPASPPPSPFLPPEAPPPTSGERSWGLMAAFGNWIVSLIFGILAPLLLLLLYGGILDRQMLSDAINRRETAVLMQILLIGTFLGQILSLAFSWLIVTEVGKKPFLETLGWQWPRNFKYYHAGGLAILMMLAGALIEYLLPHKETSMEKFLKFGLPVKITLALVATLGAPIVEEITYRGLIYTAIERASSKSLAIPIVTLLFWGVHVAQYYESIATLVAVFVLSLTLTLLRAWTGQLLPCVVVHTIFNGIQGILILFSKPKPSTPPVPTVPQPALETFWATLVHCWSVLS